jgi:hypothetical protein
MRYLPRATSTLLLVGAVVLTMSCTDLSEDPSSEITQANFDPSTEDIPNLVAPVYQPLRGFMACCFSYIGLQDEAGDMEIKPARPNGWGGPYLTYHPHDWGPTHPYVIINYPRFFDGVNAANRVIFQIESGVVPAEENREEILAELKVARAFYYAQLLDVYGNVPIVTDFELEEAPEQNTRQEVYDFVIQQLEDNIPNLPEATDLSTYGRFDKWSGKMVLAEVYLNAGVYRGGDFSGGVSTGDPGSPSDGENGEWQKVIDLTNDIINSGRFSLESDYKENYLRNTQRGSDEIIFAIPYEETEGPGNTFHMMSLTTEIQEAFNMSATPWGGGAAQPQFASSYNEDDQRLEDTWVNGTLRGPQGDSLTFYQKNIPQIDGTQFKHGWRIGKYEIYQGMKANSSVDLPFYRYAETLMMKAEALLRTGNAGEAAEIVTRVRERSFDDPAKAEVTAQELMQPSVINWGIWQGGENEGEVVEPGTGPDIKYGRFLDELGWEFAMEGHRRQDMIRFGAFTTKTWFEHRASDSQPFHRIFPIPQDVLDANPNLEQNPGY